MSKYSELENFFVMINYPYQTWTTSSLHFVTLNCIRLWIAIANHVGIMDCSSECWKYPLFTGKSCWLQLYPWSQVFGSKLPFMFHYYPLVNIQNCMTVNASNWMLYLMLPYFLLVSCLLVDWCWHWFFHCGKWSPGACNWCDYNTCCWHGFPRTGTCFLTKDAIFYRINLYKYILFALSFSFMILRRKSIHGCQNIKRWVGKEHFYMWSNQR